MFFGSLVLLIAQADKSLAGQASYPALEKVKVADTRIAISIAEISVKDLVRHFKQTFDIEIIGLENNFNDRVGLELSGGIPFVMEKILKKLGRNNYAFIFENTILKKVIVVEGNLNRQAKGQGPKTRGNEAAKSIQSTSGSISVVRDVVKNSLADEIGLQKGDIILAYDNVRIIHFNQLMEQIHKKKEKSQVSILIVRNEIPMRLNLKSGTLGVVMSQRTIDQSKLDSWYAY